MRLLNTKSLRVKEFFESQLPEYAILSHTWEDEEVLFADMADKDDTNHSQARKKAGFAKIMGACTLAACDGYDYIWIDTCCIDKSSSAELTEAINSMYRWYKSATICYAYLYDTHTTEGIGASKWLTRGWTLQELIAPRDVEFYSASWRFLGRKQDENVKRLLSKASHIHESVLDGLVPPLIVRVAKIMFWASFRVTTRLEDEAYCLMGLFGVNMPLIYGEGRRAFYRLQVEITKETNDQSILAWYDLSAPSWSTNGVGSRSDVLASSPKAFASSGDIELRGPSRDNLRLGPISVTSEGLELSVLLHRSKDCKSGSGHECINRRLEPIKTLDMSRHGFAVAVLDCQAGPIPGTQPALILFDRYDTCSPGNKKERLGGDDGSALEKYWRVYTLSSDSSSGTKLQKHHYSVFSKLLRWLALPSEMESSNTTTGRVPVIGHTGTRPVPDVPLFGSDILPGTIPHHCCEPSVKRILVLRGIMPDRAFEGTNITRLWDWSLVLLQPAVAEESHFSLVETSNLKLYPEGKWDRGCRRLKTFVEIRKDQDERIQPLVCGIAVIPVVYNHNQNGFLKRVAVEFGTRTSVYDEWCRLVELPSTWTENDTDEICTKRLEGGGNVESDMVSQSALKLEILPGVHVTVEAAVQRVQSWGESCRLIRVWIQGQLRGTCTGQC